MAFVNAFIEAGNEHRRVSLGGRRANSSAWAWLNTAHQGGCSSLRVSSDVHGPGLGSKERRRKDGDKRSVTFTVELPEPSEHVNVVIVPKGEAMRKLAMFGALLCGIKAVDEMTKGEFEKGADILAKTKEIVAGLEEGMKDLPNVTLPGGISLKHALACVELVRRLQDNAPNPN